MRLPDRVEILALRQGRHILSRPCYHIRVKHVRAVADGQVSFLQHMRVILHHLDLAVISHRQGAPIIKLEHLGDSYDGGRRSGYRDTVITGGGDCGIAVNSKGPSGAVVFLSVVLDVIGGGREGGCCVSTMRPYHCVRQA